MKNELLITMLGEIGYKEKATNSQLDSKTANAGTGNWTKYARDMDGLTDFYNGRKQTASWCDLFVDWCFYKTFGRELAQKLLCQPNKSLGAGCGYSANYYKKNGQFYDANNKPQLCDQIFFVRSNGSVYHTGLVSAVDSKYVYTIEGNKNNMVSECKYLLTSKTIYGYGRAKLTGDILSMYSKSDDLNIRNTPSSSGTIKGKLKLNDAVGVYGYHKGWYKISLNEDLWVFAKYLFSAPIIFPKEEVIDTPTETPLKDDLSNEAIETIDNTSEVEKEQETIKEETTEVNISEIITKEDTKIENKPKDNTKIIGGTTIIASLLLIFQNYWYWVLLFTLVIGIIVYIIKKKGKKK